MPRLIKCRYSTQQWQTEVLAAERAEALGRAGGIGDRGAAHHAHLLEDLERVDASGCAVGKSIASLTQPVRRRVGDQDGHLSGVGAPIGLKRRVQPSLDRLRPVAATLRRERAQVGVNGLYPGRGRRWSERMAECGRMRQSAAGDRREN